MQTLQERIDAFVCMGQHPVITFPPGAEVLMPKRRRGRPQVRDLDRPCEHYADDRACLRPVRCLATGCQRRLRAKQRGACSEACADAAFNQALAMLRMIDATREEVMEHYRGPQKPSEQSTLSQHVCATRPSERRLREARKAAARLVRGM